MHVIQRKIFMKTQEIRHWRGGPKAKSACCSSRGPNVTFQPLGQAAQNHLQLQFQDSSGLQGHLHTGIDTQVRANKHKNSKL